MITRIPGPVVTRSKVVICNGLIFTNVAPANKQSSTYTQMTNALSILDARLEEIGCSKSGIISVSIFMADLKKKDEVNRAWDAWVDAANAPIRACLGAELEGTDLVELVVIASK